MANEWLAYSLANLEDLLTKRRKEKMEQEAIQRQVGQQGFENQLNLRREGRLDQQATFANQQRERMHGEEMERLDRAYRQQQNIAGINEMRLMAGEDYTLSPGQRRFQGGRIVAENPPEMQPVTRVGRSGQLENLGEVPRGTHFVNEPAPIQPPANVILSTPEGYMRAPIRGQGPATPVLGQGGEPVQQREFAAQVERKRVKGFTIRGVDHIQKLGNQVITEVNSLAQRTKATGEAAKALVTQAPTYKTYQASRMALAGNLAVLQQGSRPSDADIKAIWLPLVPDVFSDTTGSADMKWETIRIMSGIGESGGNQPPPGTQTQPTNKVRKSARQLIEEYGRTRP